jgi:hypothetical protein
MIRDVQILLRRNISAPAKRSLNVCPHLPYARPLPLQLCQEPFLTPEIICCQVAVAVLLCIALSSMGCAPVCNSIRSYPVHHSAHSSSDHKKDTRVKTKQNVWVVYTNGPSGHSCAALIAPARGTTGGTQERLFDPTQAVPSLRFREPGC